MLFRHRNFKCEIYQIYELMRNVFSHTHTTLSQGHPTAASDSNTPVSEAQTLRPTATTIGNLMQFSRDPQLLPFT